LVEHNFTVYGWWLVKCRKECFLMIWLLISVSDWPAHHNDSSRWFAISSPTHPICCPSFNFTCGVAKRVNNWTWMLKKIFCRVTYWAPLEMLFSWWKLAKFYCTRIIQ
jgi:hypothetical protein